MARRTFTEMDAELLLRLANRTDLNAALRLRLLVDAYYDIANSFVHRELQTWETVTLALAGSSFSLTATDLWWPTLVRDVTDGRLLVPADQDLIEATTRVSGSPARYYWYGGVFYTNTLADTAKSITVWYVKRPAEPTGASTSVLDVLFDPAIIMKAAVFGFQTCRDLREAAVQEQQLQNYYADKNLPLHKAKLDDRGQGIRIRTR